MQTVSRILVSIVAFLGITLLSTAAMAGSTASAGAIQPALLTQDTVGQTQPVSLDTADLRHLTLAQAVSIIGGAVVGGALADNFIEGRIFTIIGILVGASLGNEWYERGMWPF